ncbi:MAG: hypothetical protein ACXWLH_03275 [Candidatus Saccharimonadales bacterium]
MRKLNNRGFGVVEVLLVLVIIAMVGGIGWYIVKGPKKANHIVKETPLVKPPAKKTVKSNVPSGYTSYENKELGFKFDAPAEWGSVILGKANPKAGKEVDISFSNNSKVTVTAASKDWKAQSMGFECSSPLNLPSASKPKIATNDQNITFSGTLITPVVKTDDYVVNRKFISDGCESSYSYLTGVHLIDSKTYAVYEMYSVNLKKVYSNAEYQKDEYQFITKAEQSLFVDFVKSIKAL